MKKQPSDRWINVSLVGLVLLTSFSMLYLVRSSNRVQESALNSGQNQLVQANNYFIKVLSLTIENLSVSLEDFASDNETQLLNGAYGILRNDSQFLRENQKEIDSLFFVDVHGQYQASWHYKDNQFKEQPMDQVFLEKDSSLSKLLDNHQLLNSKEYFYNDSSYINLYQAVQNAEQETVGFLVMPVNLEVVYQQKLKIMDEQYSGYPMVKNEAMQVVMHPVESQIGLSIVEDRKERFPTLDFSDLERLEELQLANESGRDKYYSYWWTEDNPQKVLKINAFQWITLGDAHWVIASNADYYEHNGLVIENAQQMLAFLAIMFAIIVLIIFVIHNYKKSTQAFADFQQLQQKRDFEREKHLLEKQLMQDNKMETIGLLTTSIVHDMNNFLTPLLGQTQLLMEEHRDEPELYADLSEIYQAAEQGQQISQNVLRFSKVENNAEIRAQQVAEVVMESVETMRIILPKRTQLRLKATQGLPPVSFDKADLQAILYNLITNAFQAMPRGAGDIQLELSLAEATAYSQFQSTDMETQAYVLLRVIDNGSGIPDELKARIFDSFFTTKEDAGGTGLGLFVVSLIAKKYNWQIQVADAEGASGTVFTIMMPAASK